MKNDNRPSFISDKSLQDGSVPDEWKDANETTTFKKGSKHSADNYQPVSLMSHVCKLFESIIRNGIIMHLCELISQYWC